MAVLSALCALFVCTNEAKAWGVYAGAHGGYGFAPKVRSAEPEPYGVGLGADAGVTLPVIPIYVGARLTWFLGQSKKEVDVGGAAASGSLKLDESYLTYGIDIGYDMELGPIILRPELGIGRATLYTNQIGTGTIGSTSASFEMKKNYSSLYLAPAAELIIKLGLLYVGAEARFLGLTAKRSHNGVALLAHLGLCI